MTPDCTSRFGAASGYLQPEGDGTVIDKVHLHVGAKHAMGGRRMQALGLGAQILEQLPARFRRRGRREARTVALAGIRRQRELRSART